MRFELAEIDLHRPDRCATQDFPWREWAQLREEAPVFWYERDDVEPFWAITRHADVLKVSENSRLFINGGPRLRLTLRGSPETLRGGVGAFGNSRGWDSAEPPDFVFMDDPRHRHTRRLSSGALTQGCMRAVSEHFDALAEAFTAEFVATLQSTASCDFVRELAAKLPLAATGEILGLPPEDWKQLLVWSNAVTGGGPSPFINRLVNGQVNGAALNDQQLNGYLFLLISAGNDTTRYATAGGVAALLENPAQRDLLCANPSLIPRAVDEMLRWTSPVISFLRTATADVSLNGQAIKAGDTLCLFYPSANRDERVFADADRFDITRDPNPHITFGFGAHFCLGANLAKAELKSILKALLGILPQLELTGESHRLGNTHVSGFSLLGVRRAGQGGT